MGTAIMRPADLYRWVEAAAPGARLVYFTGFLARCKGLAALAEAARDLQAEGVICLYQRRVGPETFAYIAQRRETADNAGVPPSAAIIEPTPERGTRRAPVHFARCAFA